MDLGKTVRASLRLTYFPAAIAALVVLACGVFVEHQNNQLARERSRDAVFHEVSLIRAKLEGALNGDIQLARGLVADIVTKPDLDQRRFAEMAASLLRDAPRIHNVAGAPGLVVSMVYPLAGNERVVGFDLGANPQQRAAALRARDSGDVVLDGPLDLVQGGRAFIARFPVFTEAPGGGKAFWGVVSEVIDIDALYRDSGVVGRDSSIELALFRVEAGGAEVDRFFGSADATRDNPVIAEVAVPSGTWRIAAIPKGGWNAAAPDRWLLRLGILAAALLVAAPTWLLGRLFVERRDHYAALRKREGELERLSQRLELALDASKVGVLEYSIDSDELVWDDRMTDLHSYPYDGGVRHFRDWRECLDPEDAERAVNELMTAIHRGGRYESQFKLKLRDGRTRVVRAIGKVCAAPDGTSKLVGVVWDVSADVALTEALKRSKAVTEARNAELEAARARIEYNSLHDFLTKLPNRMYRERALEEHAARCAASGGGVALLHLDLDGFKQINDTLGHRAGDAMLVHTADTIRDALRPGDFVARNGGDEFVAVCRADAGMAGFGELARRIIDAIRKPVLYEGHECRLGVSIGIAGASGAAVDRQRLLVNADLALYRAKSLGRNRFEFYTAELQAELLRSKQTADSIIAGLERGEFIPYFQPQVDARTFELAGLEALARWRRPGRGVVSPAEFIAIAEEMSVIGAIDRTILEQAIAHFNRWRERGLSAPRLSVNVSLRRLRDTTLIEGLRALNIAPGTLSFELLETIYLDERDDDFARTIDEIKALGVDIEIDDFGTGYASIVSLTKLKPRRLKIDRQLITPIARSQAQRRLARSIIEIGRGLGVEVVAEGVETIEHALILRELGCDFLQGYAFAPPMSAEDLEAFLVAQARRIA